MKGPVPGIKYANLWGDIMKGASGALIKLPAGLNNPLHTHSSDIKMVVVSGTFWVAREGEAPTKLGPGSYLHVPAGVKHTSGTADGEAVVFQESPGRFDLVPVAVPPATHK
jgi:quercetin dioxygenase-like cupin family protein